MLAWELVEIDGRVSAKLFDSETMLPIGIIHTGESYVIVTKKWKLHPCVLGWRNDKRGYTDIAFVTSDGQNIAIPEVTKIQERGGRDIYSDLSFARPTAEQLARVAYALGSAPANWERVKH